MFQQSKKYGLKITKSRSIITILYCMRFLSIGILLNSWKLVMNLSTCNWIFKSMPSKYLYFLKKLFIRKIFHERPSLLLQLRSFSLIFSRQLIRPVCFGRVGSKKQGKNFQWNSFFYQNYANCIRLIAY